MKSIDIFKENIQNNPLNFQFDLVAENFMPGIEIKDLIIYLKKKCFSFLECEDDNEM